MTQNWYKHPKGWVLIRAKTAEMREKIAQDMQYACDNPNIGYDQSQNTSLWSVAKSVGYDCSKVTTPCETDCARLVRVCCWYAGSQPADFYTGSEVEALRATGDFTILTDAKYTDSSQYLLRGDILVTKVKGHTVIVLSDGSKATPKARTLRKCMIGDDVKEMQMMLIALGYPCGKWGSDGEFGDATENALKKFQADRGLEIDGVYGKLSRVELMQALKASYIIGQCLADDVNYREAPSGRILGQLNKGDLFQTQGECLGDWLQIDIGGQRAWIYRRYVQF